MGIISVQLNTHGYGGKTIQKTIGGFTNDKDNPLVALIINGEIKKFAHISPVRAYLSGEAGSNIEASVKIFPAAKDLFQLVDARADSGTNIKLSLQKNEETAGTYKLYLNNVNLCPGNATGALYPSSAGSKPYLTTRDGIGSTRSAVRKIASVLIFLIHIHLLCKNGTVQCVASDQG